MESCDNCNSECEHIKECLTQSDLTPAQLGEGVGFQRLRRITGYLVGDVSRWNDGKRAELKDRVKHDSSKEG